jgi:PAS domain-containing protein
MPPAATRNRTKKIMLQTLIENVSDGIIIVGPGWEVQRMNGRAETLFRRRAGNTVGQPLWEALPDVAGSPFEDEVRTASQQGQVRIFEHFYPSLYAWHKVRAVPVEGGGMALVMSDVTEISRRQHTEAVREAVRSVVRQVPVAISILRGPDHRFEVVNEMARLLIGDREVEGRTARDAFPELEPQGYFGLLDEVYRTGRAYQGHELPVRYDRTGSGDFVEGYFNVVYQPLLEADGRVSGIVSISVDVTHLVAQRREMAHQAAENRAVLAQLMDGVIVTDARGRIRFVNEAAERMHGGAKLGVGPDEYTAEYHLLTEDGAPYPADQLPLTRAVLHDEVVEGARWRIRPAQGPERLVTGSARPVYSETGEKLGAVLTLREVG